MTTSFAWEGSYPTGLSWHHPIETGLVTTLLDDAAAAVPNRTVLSFRKWQCTYGQLRSRADAFAAALVAQDLAKNRAIAIYLPNTPYHPIAFFGGLRAGARLVHLSPLDAPRELAHKAKDSGARTIITTNVGGMLAKAIALLDAGVVDHIIVGDDAAFGEEDSAREPIPCRADVSQLGLMSESAVRPDAWPELSEGDPALLQYTGGTTGLPKAAILTHANLTAAISIYKTWFKRLHGARDDWRILCALPLFHIYGLTSVFLCGISEHAEFVLHMRFDADQVISDIEERQVTSFSGVPTMWIALANHPDIMHRDLSSLRRCISGGSPLPVEVIQRLEKLTGQRLSNGWGMTETSPAGTYLYPPTTEKLDSIGIPLPGVELQVVSLDDARRILGVGEIGELRVRGKNVTPGYWNRSEETAAAFVDGYFLTGDVGYMDGDGYFYIADRKKDMIISGGFNVYPQMIERAIQDHPAVAECIVIGIPDAYRGEAAKAFVKLRPGAEPFSLESLHLFLADRLGRHELPRGLEFRDALPMTAVGKPARRDLRDEERLKYAEKQTTEQRGD